MQKFELKSHPDFGYVLFKDGKESFCPFQQVTIIKDEVGENTKRMPCNSSCPHAKIKVTDFNKDCDYSYQITCGCEVVKYHISSVIDSLF